MFKPLVNYLIKRKAKDDDRVPSKLHGNLIMKVAVVACYSKSKDFELVSKYVDELRGRGLKVVDFYLYFEKKKSFEQFEPPSYVHPFRSSGFSWIGKFKTEALKHSVQKEYDVLIDLTRGKSFASDVLIAKTKASWKAGEHDADRTHLLDFMIDVKGDPDVQKLIHHLDHYLTNFNKLNAA